MPLNDRAMIQGESNHIYLRMKKRLEYENYQQTGEVKKAIFDMDPWKAPALMVFLLVSFKARGT